MSSIGPQLPPHLQKRKRTADDDEGSPPPKTSRRDNHDEIALDDDSDDDFGPSAPQSTTNHAPSRIGPAIGPSLTPAVAKGIASAPADQQRRVGPSLPPSAAPTNEDEIPLDDDSDDDETGPAPPPTKAGPAPPPKRVLGPAPPPADLSERPTTGPDSDSSDDDDWGPALPGAAGGSKASTTPHPAFAAAQEAQPTAPKRDDWMLAPPTSGGYRAPDPTKLKSRKFASGPHAATDGKPTGVSSIWTETPEEKARRLANAVLGREDPNAHVQPSGGARPSRPETSSTKAEDEARIRAYTEQTRGKSLVEQHQAAKLAKKTKAEKAGDKDTKWGGKADDEEDDPSKRAFDWEKDMKVGGSISGAQRKQLLNKAANLGGRFQTGKYL